MFANVSNHPLATWSAEQLAAAAALGHGQPADLPGVELKVDVRATTADVEHVADAIMQRLVDAGVQGAHVATEFTLTVALVDRLRARGIPVYAATTVRDAREDPGPGGTIVRTQVFKFVAWRAYGGLPRG